MKHGNHSIKATRRNGVKEHRRNPCWELHLCWSS